MAVQSPYVKLSSVSPAVVVAVVDLAAAVVAVATAAASVRAARVRPTAVAVVVAATVAAVAVAIAAAVVAATAAVAVMVAAVAMAAVAAMVAAAAVATEPATAAVRCAIVVPTSLVRRLRRPPRAPVTPPARVAAKVVLRIVRVASGTTSRASGASTTTSRIPIRPLPDRLINGNAGGSPPACLFAPVLVVLCFVPSAEAGMKRRSALIGSLAAMATATSARAETPVDLQLVLAVDVSRSIDEVEAELQRRGYVEALTNDRVIDAILSGEHKRIAVCYTEWAGTHYQVVVLDWTVIDSAGAARRFAEKLSEAPRTSQSWTAVGAALAHAGQRFENSGLIPKRRVIDISGDGRTNDGPAAEIIRDRLVSQGIVVNGLPVMMNRNNFGRPPDLTLDKYYEENVIGGPGSFMIVADNFEHFGRAVRTKLVREISDASGPRRSSPA